MKFGVNPGKNLFAKDLKFSKKDIRVINAKQEGFCTEDVDDRIKPQLQVKMVPFPAVIYGLY
jgi:hypothetical protein